MKVLYVCPFAAHTGHPPWAAQYEPEALAKNGIIVDLLTFSGIRSGCRAEVDEYIVFEPLIHKTISRVFERMRSRVLTQWILRVVEVSSTLIKAVQLSKDYDFIHLRDGEPLLFASRLVAIPYRIKWLISLTGGNLSIPNSSKETSNGKLMPIYRGLFNFFVNNPVWKLLYRFQTRKFRYITQDDQTRIAYYPLFKNKITTVPMGSYQKNTNITKAEARRYLGLAQDAVVVLLFGVPHSGKNSKIIFEAVSQCDNIILISAGDSSMSLGERPEDLANQYDLGNRVHIFNRFIPESEKAYFFKAADATILSYTKKFDSTSSMLWESCSYGTPVISSDANTLGRLVKDNDVGMIFKAESAEDLLVCLMDLQNHPEFMVGSKAYCDKFVQKYSLDVWANKIKDLYGK